MLLIRVGYAVVVYSLGDGCITATLVLSIFVLDDDESKKLDSVTSDDVTKKYSH